MGVYAVAEHSGVHSVSPSRVGFPRSPVRLQSLLGRPVPADEYARPHDPARPARRATQTPTGLQRAHPRLGSVARQSAGHPVAGVGGQSGVASGGPRGTLTTVRRKHRWASRGDCSHVSALPSQRRDALTIGHRGCHAMGGDLELSWPRHQRLPQLISEAGAPDCRNQLRSQQSALRCTPTPPSKRRIATSWM